METVRLANVAQSTCPILSSEPSPYFTILLIVQYESHSIKVSVLLDSEASTCFIDKDFMKYHKLLIVTKKCLVSVKVIDGRSLASSDVIYETQPSDISIHGYCSTVIFNVISEKLIPTTKF